MADAAVAPSATPKGKKVGTGKPRKSAAAKPSHPPYAAMVHAAVKNLKERNGSSRQAILKYILANYKVGDEKKATTRLRLALKKGITSGALKQAKGAGASGSFKLPEKASSATAGKKVTKKAKSPKKAGAKKSPKKAAAKKPAGEKVAKPKKAKTPKKPKVAKPKKVKTPKKPATPKPVAEKKPAAPKPAKKSPAKKATKKPAAKKAPAKK